MADAVASGPEVCGFRSEHLRGAMELFAAEGWDTYTADPERTLRALTAPGSTTVVAVDGGAVAALVQLQSDGEIQAHLSALVVGERWRRRGLGRTLLREALERAGGLRIDLITRAGDYYLAIGAEPAARRARAESAGGRRAGGGAAAGGRRPPPPPPPPPLPRKALQVERPTV